MSDRIAVMSRGAVEQVSSPAELYERPTSVFVANFIGVSNVYRSRVMAVTGGVAECLTDAGLRVLASRDASDRVRVGDSVGVVVRPEKILIGAPDGPAAAAGCENVFPGTIKTVVYVGPVTQFVVDLGGRCLAQVLQQNLASGSRARWREGQTVSVSFAARSCSLIRELDEGLADEDLMGEVVRRL